MSTGFISAVRVTCIYCFVCLLLCGGYCIEPLPCCGLVYALDPTVQALEPLVTAALHSCSSPQALACV
jgi:hypothetical protein